MSSSSTEITARNKREGPSEHLPPGKIGKRRRLRFGPVVIRANLTSGDEARSQNHGDPDHLPAERLHLSALVLQSVSHFSHPPWARAWGKDESKLVPWRRWTTSPPNRKLPARRKCRSRSQPPSPRSR